MRAIFLDCTPALAEVLKAVEIPTGISLVTHVGDPPAAAIVGHLMGHDVALVEHTYLDAPVLRRCSGLRWIVFLGVGASSYIDLAEAARLGIRVSTIDNYGSVAVAEHSVALLFAAARGIAISDRALRAGVWEPLMGMQLRGKQLAVVGLGAIGREVAAIAAGIGMIVRGWNRTPRDVSSYVSELDEALSGADAVTLHLSLNVETRGILNRRRLSLPKRGYLLVNTARAGLTDQSALLEGLQSGQIGHAALDVFDREPISREDPLMRLENVTASPHAAFMTWTASKTLLEKAMALLADESCHQQVTVKHLDPLRP